MRLGLPQISNAPKKLDPELVSEGSAPDSGSNRGTRMAKRQERQ